MSLPLVSIVIPVYNGCDYMREAIDSALNQTYKNIEILVVNDGSTDGGETERTALSYGDKIRYIKKENGGVSSALNLGIKNMRGEYFSWLSHDDVYTPHKVEAQVKTILESKEEKALVLSNYSTIDKDSKPMGDNHKELPTGSCGNREAIMHVMRNSPHGCAFLVPKRAFDDAGMFNEDLRYCQDIFMWWKIFLCGYTLVFCSDYGVLARVHSKQLTQTGAALFHHDANYISDIIVPEFAAVSDKEVNCLYEYAKGEAIHRHTDIISKCKHAAKEKKLFGFKQKIHITMLLLYGLVRPALRKAYYKFRKVKTQ